MLESLSLVWKARLLPRCVSDLRLSHGSALICLPQGTDGFWIQGEASSSVKESTGLYVYTSDSTILGSVEVGDAITLSGKIEEYAEYSEYLTATELEDPTDIKVVSTGNEVTPLVIGVDRIPPTFYLSSLDTGNDGWLSVPNNVTQQEDGNPELDPTTYGLDFWESLEGQIVTIPSPTAADFNDDYGEIFVYGSWPVTGLNARGGLTITASEFVLRQGSPERSADRHEDSDGVPDGIPGIVQASIVSSKDCNRVLTSFSPSFTGRCPAGRYQQP